MKQDLHEHLLVHFDEIGLDPVLCASCNALCNRDLFRCFPCNFNIHSGCLPSQREVYHDDLHVHPLVLTSSYKEDEYSGKFYCDVCEESRDPDYGVYCCKECKFVAHIHCAISYILENETQVEPSSPEKQLEDNLEYTSINQQEGETKIMADNHAYEQFSTFVQIREEMVEIRETLQALEETLGKQMQAQVEDVSEKLKELL
ncbi:protein VACUOLELESS GAMETOPHYTES [Ziziphus jujuba]|uniref:Protein VACUOLELESS GAMETOPHYTES n=1 Tax=Ziziphus jujuba TaxID=326968 RepID=A0ABM3IL31_ZIZJJ|nr:protein VACUOLELESS GAMETOPHYTES [Ziziphus jujuba]